jgi:hypothetical protein
MAPALALILVAAPAFLPPPQARALPPWYYAVDCYTPAPAIGAMQGATGNFDAYSAYGGAANDLACWELNEVLRHRGP